YDNSIGYLEGGPKAWKKAGEQVEMVEEVSPSVSKELFRRKNPNVIDARKESEYNTEHLRRVKNIPLDFINKNMNRIKRNEKYYLHCASGYRSLIAASILKARGIHDVVNVLGGYNELSKMGLRRTEFKERLTEL